MISLALGVEQGQSLQQCIGDLLVQMEASVALLTDIGGNILAQSPAQQDLTVQTIAALAAGAFSATRELARVTGESSFKCVAHEGERTGLFVQELPGDFLLVVVYPRTTTLGLVKLYAQRAIPALAEQLRALRQESPHAGVPLAFAESESSVFDIPAAASTPASADRAAREQPA